MGHPSKHTDINRKAQTKEKLRARKKASKKNKRRARVIVRNLPFATTEENLRHHFETFGEVDEVQILKREEGQLVGCAFVQFKLVQKAAKAIHHLNGKPFLKRAITCGWAQPKTKFDQQNKVDKVIPDGEIKEEPIEIVKIKTEVLDDDELKTDNKEDSSNEKNQNENSDLTRVNTDVETIEDDLDGEDGNLLKKSDDESKMEDEEEEHESNNTDEDSDNEDFEDDDSNNKSNIKTKKFDEPRKPLRISNDVVEGKTVFIKNLPFTATKEDLRECMLQFGPVYYALVCTDRFTEHSKGSGFVKFVNKEDADKCLQSPGTTVLGLPIECHVAVSKNELEQKSNEKSEKNKNKDSRNLYLVKEGLILAGTKAAEDVSAADMAKRLQLEQYKTQMLRNLNMFIARTRLVIHNIPPHWDDQKLRMLVARHAGKKAVIREARIMRNFRDLDSSGAGQSKEYGFISFTSHEDALKTLRSLNNNPDVFTKAKRPIVSFSIENRTKLNEKEKRLQYSKFKNPKCKEYNAKFAKSGQNKTGGDQKGQKRSFNEEVVETGDQSEFSGVNATPGVKKMRSRFNLRTQAKLHHETLKQQKKKRKLENKKNEPTKQPKQKQGKKTVQKDDNFSKLVSDYKQKLINASTLPKKNKWYE